MASWHRYIISSIIFSSDIDDLPNLMSLNKLWYTIGRECHVVNMSWLTDLDLSVKRNRKFLLNVSRRFNAIDISKNSKHSWKLLAKYTKRLILKERQDIKLEDFVYFLENSHQLRELNVEGCDWVNDSVIDALPCRIVSLNIDHADGIPRISKSAVETLLERHYMNLEELVLDASLLRDENLEDIAKCSKLKKLCVSSCENLTNTFLGYIKSLQNLTCLRLKGGNDFTKEGLVSLFECESYLHLIECRCLQQLVELDLSDSTDFDDDCVDQMIRCCGATIEILRVSSSVAITDVGYESIENKCCKKVVITQHKRIKC
ncbi:F-box/LRR-repeat protein 20-like [Saccostrea cucullata]|uniref:F-box/LRR-repeat protein 20-like n=1 Tax=Saccostrea cuccullata TaxID=36930 RepID=UPI002ED20D5E